MNESMVVTPRAEIQDRDVSTLSTASAGGGGGGGQAAAAAEADDSVLHFEHTFQARLLEPTGAGGGGAEEAAAALALLSLPMPTGGGPGAPPTHQVYPPGHPHHLHPHQAQSPAQQSAGGGGAAYRERPVRITLVGEKLTVEEDVVALSKAKPAPLLEASFGEVRGVKKGVQGEEESGRCSVLMKDILWGG
jgi:hypothetical protein